MIRFVGILKIELEEHLLIKYYGIKHLLLLKIQSMMDIKEVLLQRSINFLIKNLLEAVLKMKTILIRISQRITQTNY